MGSGAGPGLRWFDRSASTSVTSDIPATATVSAETLVLLRELNHRVKNNFQIIASLINLKKRVAHPSAGDEIRFIEEHVTTMAVAYRLVYETGSMSEVAAAELLPALVGALRGIAGLSADQISIEGAPLDGMISLDDAIAVGLYLAVALPPYLDHALANRGRVVVTTETAGPWRCVSIQGEWGKGRTLDFLREKLMAAYVHQLAAKSEQDDAAGSLSLRMKVRSAE